ncbi:hypothetical protein [Paenibacillus sp. HW567]|uniref:hypothetical protein n=1 Tax=Paenibacillus sp. HW567 TaxID=1034769 RepID=UPI0003642EE8|nr:hypothetical protein [Paenibacillus sp. HW567]
MLAKSISKNLLDVLVEKAEKNYQFVLIKRFMKEKENLPVENLSAEGYQVEFSDNDYINFVVFTNSNKDIKLVYLETFKSEIGVPIPSVVGTQEIQEEAHKYEYRYEFNDHTVVKSPKILADNAPTLEVEEEGSVTPQDKCSIHGNWCGPGCSGPSGPVDRLDECCMIHDQCYGVYGYFTCGCDRNLLACIDSIGGIKAVLVRAYFTGQSTWVCVF